ncbi:MAG: PKD domain-containing protein, partial [Acidobacteriota bacterium]
VSTSIGQAPLEMIFDGSASTDADGEVAGFAWDFGDGTRADGARISHTYAEPGLYQVTLAVGNGLGIDTTSRVVDVGSTTNPTLVFSDGFDIGTTAAWSSVVP